MIGLLLKHSFNEANFASIKKNDDICIFSTVAPPEKLDKPFFQTLRVYDFKETVVATDITTAMLASTLMLPKKKYFYIRSFEWVGFEPLMYKELEDIYLNEELELIVSNESDYHTIKNLFREPKYIVKNWDFSEIEND